MANEIPPGRGFTRASSMVLPDFDPDKPRVGRRESEPHSAEISYLFDVLRTNFPNDRVMWDLHHVFKDVLDVDGEASEIDIQFDISFFKDLAIDQELPSYIAAEHGNRVPTMAINVLSKSTWPFDLSDHVDKCRHLGIPLYIVFPAYHVATSMYRPPFLRAFIMQGDAKEYTVCDLHQALLKEGEHLTADRCGEDKLIDTSGIVPFRIGLMERRVKVKGGLSAWRMVLVHPTEPRLLQTRLEQEKARAEQEKARADHLEALVTKYKDKFGSLD